MSRFPRIESRQNPRVKNLVKLQKAKERAAQQCFLIEGELELTRALEAGVELDDLYICPEHWRDEAAASKIIADAEARQTKVIETTRDVFAKISLREGPDGLIGVGRFIKADFHALNLPASPLIIIVEQIEKPGNLGALIRTAEAAGADALIACDAVTDFENPQVIRNSRGLVFSMPCLRACQTDVDAFLREHEIRAVATTPDAEQAHWNADLTGPLAIFAGAEHEGLSDFWLERTEVKVRIPMVGQADSLNVNVATAVVLFEAKRQRATS